MAVNGGVALTSFEHTGVSATLPSSLEPAELLERLGDVVAITIIDHTGHLTHVSNRWCQLSGWPRHDAIGAHWSFSVHPDHRPAAVAAGREAVRTGAGLRYDSYVLSQDGASAIWLRTEVSPLRDDRGEVTSWLTVATEITGLKDAVEALAQSEQHLQVIFDNSSDIITVLEKDGSGRFSSSNTRDFLGYGDRIPEGGPWVFVHPDDLPAAERAFAEVLSKGSNAQTRLECRLIRGNGDIVWVETAAVNLLADPAVAGVVLHTRDVTERHQAEERLRSVTSRLTTLLSNLQVGVVMTDAHHKIVAANDTWCSIFHLDLCSDDIVGMEISRLDTAVLRIFSDPADVSAWGRQVVAARERTDERHVALANGRTLAVCFMPILVDGTYQGYMWQFRDVSDEVANAARREELLNMEKEQNARLTELDALKSDLVASVSHELRTPLTSIVSFTELLGDGLGPDENDEQHEFLGIIRRNSDRLLRLVDDLLLLDQLESSAGMAPRGPVAPAAVVEIAVSSLRPIAEAKDVELDLHTEKGPLIVGDADRLGQLTDNLLANVVKFTPPGGQITVRTTPIDRGWRLQVADTGIGIPEGEAAGLFDRFTRASNAAERVGARFGTRSDHRSSDRPVAQGTHRGRERGGSGEHVHGRSLRCRPIAADRVGAGGVGAGGVGAGGVGAGGRVVTPARVLVVEDDNDIWRSLEIILRRAGYESRWAPDGIEGLRLVDGDRFDLVLLDISLPGVDGWGVLERIRHQGDTPVILLSARGLETDKVRGLRSGADDYLTKPFNKDELVARVATHLRRSGNGRDLR